MKIYAGYCASCDDNTIYQDSKCRHCGHELEGATAPDPRAYAYSVVWCPTCEAKDGGHSEDGMTYFCQAGHEAEALKIGGGAYVKDFYAEGYPVFQLPKDDPDRIVYSEKQHKEVLAKNGLNPETYGAQYMYNPKNPLEKKVEY